MSKYPNHGIFINGLRTTMKKGKLKELINQMIYELNVKIPKSRTRVIEQKSKTFAFVNFDDSQTLDYVLYHLHSEESRRKVNFDFYSISQCLKDFYITRQKNNNNSPRVQPKDKINDRNIDYSNNGLQLQGQEKSTVEAGTSISSLTKSSGSHIAKGRSLDAATSVSGLTPSVTGKFYRLNDKLGNETRNVEFKEGRGNYKHSVLNEHVGKYVCGFINSLEGGTLFVGVNDKGLIQGVICSQQEEDCLRLKIDQAIKQIDPSIFPQMYSVSFIPVLNNGTFSDNLKVIEVNVHPSEPHDELYEFKGSVYVRRDGSIQSLKPKDIKAWAKKKAADDLATNRSVKEQLDDMTSRLQELQTHIKETKEKKSTICLLL
ncbi:hypothetical protein SNE40_021725 [Patella caerulea]|uniref:RRM domain-containing protein n=2 Tax=Patella caerulea TaxID=87958 RepID=A0AAN8GJ49_PATCE